MKKTLLLASVLAAPIVAHAQNIPAGTISLGGGVGYSHSSAKGTDVLSGSSRAFNNTGNSFILSATSGYFLRENLAVGVTIGYYNQQSKQEATTYSSNGSVSASSVTYGPTTNWRAGGFVQYYKMLSDHFGVTGALGTGYERGQQRNYGSNSADPSTSSYKGTNSGYYVDLTPAIIFFPVPKFAVSASMGSLSFSHVKTEGTNFYAGPTYNDSSKAEGTNNGFGANFGLNQLLFNSTFYFNR